MEAEHHIIAYSYDVGETIERFKTCTPEEQGNIEAHIAKVIIDSFVKPADDDYLAARALAIGTDAVARAARRGSACAASD